MLVYSSQHVLCIQRSQGTSLGSPTVSSVLGHSLELGFIGAGIIALLVLVFNYKRINAKRERQLAAGEHNGYTPEELGELGDRSMTFKYVL